MLGQDAIRVFRGELDAQNRLEVLPVGAGQSGVQRAASLSKKAAAPPGRTTRATSSRPGVHPGPKK